MNRPDFEALALALVGTRFRPQGRSDEALDCLGLVLRVYDIPSDMVRSDYRLRGDHQAEILTAMKRHFRTVAVRRVKPGDALLFEVAPDQCHFVVKSVRGCVHADATIGKIVERPGFPEWALIKAFRRRCVAKQG